MYVKVAVRMSPRVIVMRRPFFRDRVVNKQKIRIFERRFPLAQTNKNESANGNSVAALVATPKFVANVTNQGRAVFKRNIAMRAVNFGNNGNFFKFIGRKRNCPRMIASKFACERFRASATRDIANHVIYC